MKMLNVNERRPTFLMSAPHCHHDGGERFARVAGEAFNQSLEFHPDTCTYRVDWSINAHMQVGKVNILEAIEQHRMFRRALHEAGAHLLHVPFLHGSYDSVFVKDNALLAQKKGTLQAYLSRPACTERRQEPKLRQDELQCLGFEIVGASAHPFEGGDIVVAAEQKIAFLGYGFRSTSQAVNGVSEFLEMPVMALKLVDPYFYHLDTALAVLADGSAFAYKDAFSEQSWKQLKRCHALSSLTTVSREEAMKFGLNWVEVYDTVIVGSNVPKIITMLKARGKKVRVAPLSQFQLAGGSAACLVAGIHDI